MNIGQTLDKYAIELFSCKIHECTKTQVYEVLLTYTKDLLQEKPYIKGEKRVYYFSAEFLIGKLLSNNLINLGIYDKVNRALERRGFSLSEIEEIELEPSLGNGGLGRLAACFLDSIATLNLPGDGIGLNYHLGLFKQIFRNQQQIEVPNRWIEEKSWLNKQEDVYYVRYGNMTLKSILYDIDIIGYKGKKNKLHLFDIETVDESIVKNGISFDLKDIEKNLTLFLYPDDSTKDGQLLRLYQQYFMVSSGAQLIIKDLRQRHIPIDKMDKYVAIQINDTHPSLIIPELISQLMRRGVNFKDSIDIVTNTCAYTNHTILAEALETWDLKDLEIVVPHLVPIIQALNVITYARNANANTAIIDSQNRVHMAHMDIHFSHSVNGVAAIHTDILKHVQLKQFYELYPDKFNNKTNGITFRRWLLESNPELTKLLDNTIGTDYKKDAMQLEKFLEFKESPAVLNDLLQVKLYKKFQLASYIKRHENITIDPYSIFDIQVKRLHEYKRQQMNALYIIHLYLLIKDGYTPKQSITSIFGAKAAPAYTTAKDIIHLLLCLQKLINDDPDVSPYLKVVMLKNYNVSYAEHIIPAADISEQISLASKEASGTGNMKLMLNGAVTIGTDDGANVEIHELVGDDNIYIFGKDSDTIIQHYENNDYHPEDYLKGPEINRILSFLKSEELLSIGDKNALERLYEELTTRDYFMSLLDLKDYIKTKNQAIHDYTNRESWAKKMIVNIGKAGYFSSDRTIKEYNEDIWKL